MLSGYANAETAGHRVSFFDILAISPAARKRPAVAGRGCGALAGQFVVYATAAIHVAAALARHIVRRSGVFECRRASAA